jgi:hypothetical protein
MVSRRHDMKLYTFDERTTYITRHGVWADSEEEAEAQYEGGAYFLVRAFEPDPDQVVGRAVFDDMDEAKAAPAGFDANT